MFGKIFSASLQGINARIVEVEVDAKKGLPGHNIVGLPDTAVKESKNRVEAAIKNSGYVFPVNQYFTINLAPAYLKKEGALYDLPIALGILVVTGQVSDKYMEDSLFIGELSLDGNIKPVHGILSICMYAKEKNIKRVFLPEGNAPEGALVKGVDIIPVKDLKHAASLLGGQVEMSSYELDVLSLFEKSGESVSDFAEVKGQEFVKRGVEISAAGGHNLLMVGSPGCGKTMIAKRIPSILPAMTVDEALEVTRIYSIIGHLSKEKSLVTERPFRSPHHTVSNVALVGGSSVPKPGAVSMAHNGVLFLDELAEFKREALEVLRQPLEDGAVTISRARSTLSYPAQFMLVAAVNPCPCGYAFDDKVECTCTPQSRHRYWQKLSGPLLDRIDLHIEVRRMNEQELMQKEDGENSDTIRERVEKAREIQQKRFDKSDQHCNAQMTPGDMKRFCKLDEIGETLMRKAISNLNLSARSYDKILKVARTVADIEGSESIQSNHLAEAIQYRGMDRQQKV